MIGFLPTIWWLPSWTQKNACCLTLEEILAAPGCKGSACCYSSAHIKVLIKACWLAPDFEGKDHISWLLKVCVLTPGGRLVFWVHGAFFLLMTLNRSFCLDSKLNVSSSWLPVEGVFFNSKKKAMLADLESDGMFPVAVRSLDSLREGFLFHNDSTRPVPWLWKVLLILNPNGIIFPPPNSS